jgi:hypothetical protein
MVVAIMKMINRNVAETMRATRKAPPEVERVFSRKNASPANVIVADLEKLCGR